jgi:hypothetical protein
MSSNGTKKNEMYIVSLQQPFMVRPITKANKTERAVGKTCILGLGYGTGWAKLQQTLKLAAGVELDERECKRLVSVYRNINSKVIDLWRECEEALRDIAHGLRVKNPILLVNKCVILLTPQGIQVT